MHIDDQKYKRDGKKYRRVLLRNSYRENGVVRHKTIANLSHCSDKEIEAIKLALKHKDNLSAIGNIKENIKMEQGLSVGAVWLLSNIAKRLGIKRALGDTNEGRLALWQILARIIDQGSRLSAVRLATQHNVCDILGLEKFNEYDLYKNLDWLAENQEKIEDQLFKQLGDENPQLFLYDVTSSYLEGTCNELAAYGYNRDGKRGKLQIVLGLLCNAKGIPLTIEVFEGNTLDMKTLSSQIEKAAKRFGVKKITFVGDRGMIKSTGIKDLKKHGFHYITAITKSQIEAMLDNGAIQLSLFDEDLAEVTIDDVRYILRRNLVRVEEIKISRESKLASLQKLVATKNEYLKLHKRAKIATALRAAIKKANQLNITKWLLITDDGEKISVEIDQQKLLEQAKLDGCYVLKTDLPNAEANKETIHARYKDLALVEQAFRSSKTVFLDLRPIYVRLEERTRGHAFVVMLAYRIIKELADCWRELDTTIDEGIKILTTLCAMQVKVNEKIYYNQIPKPNKILQQLFKKAGVVTPEVLPKSNRDQRKVATIKKLQTERKFL